jgi:hypothetical protein
MMRVRTNAVQASLLYQHACTAALTYRACSQLPCFCDALLAVTCIKPKLFI